MNGPAIDFLPRMKAYRIPGLTLDSEHIHPDYLGGSIYNLPSSICQVLGAPPMSAPPLRQGLLTSDSPTVQRVILILVDALALHRLQRWMEDGTSPVWQRLLNQGQLAAITSVTPSTTATVLTSIWTGKSPAEHGIVGYELWLKEYGVVSNMILHSPINYENDAGSLAKAGFKPDQFLGSTVLGSHLSQNGIRSYALQHRSIIRSGLSQMFFKDVDVHGVFTSTELWVNLRHLVESNPRQRQFFWVYTGQLDHYSHFYHPDDERTSDEFADFSRAFEQQFLNKLSPAIRRGTMVILTADHGMIATRPGSRYDLRNHPDLNHHLHILPTGEHRLMYLFIKPGHEQDVQAYFERTWPGQFYFLRPSEAVERGLFGPGNPHPRLFDRMGDLIAVAKQDAYLWWADKDNLLIGQHGGLSLEEMAVPLLSGMM